MSKKRTQNIIVIISAVAAVGGLALVTVAFTTGLFQGAGNDGKGYKNTTFTDATLACEKEVTDEFGKKLSQKVVDNHSSRFENQTGLYKIFLKAYTKVSGRTSEYYISCFVWARNGRISKFEVSQNQEAPKTEAITRGSDKFIGWPQ